ncbi:MAG: hypothetical protein NTZ16_08695 [Verrucomicrobia bacterium]|nr:hypothetical protein [Verrucomicrobiota bacterium]
MSAPEIALFAATVQAGGHYLEYGAGGSTKLVAALPQIATITSVESDPAYLRDHLAGDAAIQAATQAGRLRFLVADIGPIGEWGYPADASKDYLWPDYALCPYRHGYRPDVILIDGRFRVACGLLAALQAPAAAALPPPARLRCRRRPPVAPPIPLLPGRPCAQGKILAQAPPRENQKDFLPALTAAVLQNRCGGGGGLLPTQI